jgi:hypothetical protein
VAAAGTSGPLDLEVSPAGGLLDLPAARGRSRRGYGSATAEAGPTRDTIRPDPQMVGLTFANAAGASNNKINFLDIERPG